MLARKKIDKIITENHFSEIGEVIDDRQSQ
jgi:hypothetical protein